MRIPTWRLVLTGGAILVLLSFGIGFVAASGAHPATALLPAPAASAGPDASHDPGPGRHDGGHRFAGKLGRLGFGRHLVHVTGTFTDKDGNLVTFQLDHGTVQAIGAGSLTIAEAGGSSVTVSTDDDTKVWVGRAQGKLSDLGIGDTVFVQSRVDGSTLAKRILEVEAPTGN
jgi:hypothetical protein